MVTRSGFGSCGMGGQRWMVVTEYFSLKLWWNPAKLELSMKVWNFCDPETM